MGVSKRTIARKWARAKDNRANGHIDAYVAPPERKGRCGRKWKWDRDELSKSLLSLPLEDKLTLSSLSQALQVPKTSLWRIKEQEEDCITPHSSAIKPLLSEENKVERIYYGAARLTENTDEYEDFYETIHINEKWFFVCQKALHCYLGRGEIPPERFCKHKSHIEKIMFLVAVARPRFDAEGNCIFDGKIGCWPFIEMKQAQRNSPNRDRGTWEIHNINVTKEVYLDFMLNKVLPAVKQKWPDRGLNRRVRIQHDNAKTHFKKNHPLFLAAGSIGRWNITIQEQPPNSPDFNVLDLAFFRSLQSLQWRLAFPNNKEELLNRVMEAWENYPPPSIDSAFHSLVLCIDESVKNRGCNVYEIPHTNKEQTRRENNGVLPMRCPVSQQAREVYQDMGLL